MLNCLTCLLNTQQCNFLVLEADFCSLKFLVMFPPICSVLQFLLLYSFLFCGTVFPDVFPICSVLQFLLLCCFFVLQFLLMFAICSVLQLIPYAEEIMVDHQCGFRRNRSTTDHIFCIRQILEEKWEHNEAVHQLFIDFKKAYDSVRREALYNILIQFGIPKKLVRLIKM